MGFKLVDEVLDHAPAELTMPERFLLVLLAKAARDEARTCWPGMDTLARQMGVSPRRVRQVLNLLAQRGYEVRIPASTDRNGKASFARRGRATVYRLPVFDPGKGEASCHLSTPERRKHPTAFDSGKGGNSRPKRGKLPVRKAVGVLPPSHQEPSENHQIIRPRAEHETLAVIEALRNRTGKTIDHHHAALVIKQLVDGRNGIRDRTKYLTAAIAKDPDPGRFLPTPGPPRYERDPAGEVAR